VNVFAKSVKNIGENSLSATNAQNSLKQADKVYRAEYFHLLKHFSNSLILL